MIPIIYESTETLFDRNGLGRLRDCISCVVTEERNGIYECDFEYPTDGAHYDLIKCGRIIGVTHDDTGDIQPFDIVSYSKPINGIVTFHAVHISYRQSGYTVHGTNINSLADAFTLIKNNATPANPFVYNTDITSSNYMSAADGIPRTVRQMLGGVEGSILDTYGGEYKWDGFNVYLYAHRGKTRNFTIRYKVNLLDFNDETDYQSTYTSVIPFWKSEDEYGATQTVIGNKVSTSDPSYNGRESCVPLDLSDKFETKPTTAQLESRASSILQANQPTIPSQTITVDFIRLQDMSEFSQYEPLLDCELCDTIKVQFPMYEMSGDFKIVKTVWNVLEGKFDSMELGNLSTSLAEALGITESTSGGESSGYAFVKLSGDTMTGNLTLENHNSPIGWYDAHNGTSSIAHSTSYTDITGSSFSLPAGRYIATASINYTGNATGYRGLSFKTSSGGRTESSVLVQANPSSSWSTRVSSTFILIVDTTDTLSLMGLQSSGSSLNAEWYIKVMRIR